jgi:murein DD-endopeptidase MepM/ murein hydrolase activator NlpD
VHGPVAGRRITSGFGVRVDPFTRRLARHNGIDIAAPRNTPITAAGAGRVTYAGYRSTHGNTVEINHGNGLTTRYSHAARVLVRRGEVVRAAQPIAVVGSTGRSTGPHLHFEVLRNGTPVEPTVFLPPIGT